MLLSIPLPHDRYNNLPHVDEQPTPPSAFLEVVGEMFLRHNIHEYFGLSLLHKHFKLQPHEIMLHRDQAGSPEAPVKDLEGRSYYLHQDGFQAYEFQFRDRITCTPGRGFLVDLRDLLQAYKLETIIGLTRINPDTPVMLERLYAQSRRHISTPLTDEADENMVITQWRFEQRDGGGVAVHAISKCYKPSVPPYYHMEERDC